MTTKVSKKTATASSGRRKFLKTAAVTGGAAAIGFPMIARAQTPVTFRFQSTWPTKDIFHEYALDYAKKVNDMSGGRLKIDVLPAGSVVKAFDLLDAVNKGTLDGGHGVSAYWYGKNSAYSLFGTGPSFGMDANMLLSWYEYGGGKQLYNDLHQNVMKFDVVGLLYGPMPTQPLGWFKKQVTSPNDFKGLKYRTVGLSVDVFKEMGSAVVSLPGGEIVPALDRGLIDAAEFNNASSDRLLGFPGRLQDLHAAKLPSAPRVLRGHLQQEAVRRAAGRHQDHHHHCGPGLERRHVVEGDRPLFEGLRRDEGAGRQVLSDPEGSAAGPARRVGQGRRCEKRGEPVLQAGARVPAQVRAAGGGMVE